MTTFILHGGFTREQNASNDGFFREITKNLKDGATILLAYFATEDPKKIPGYLALHSERLAASAPEKKFQYVRASEHDLRWQLERADALYLQGGSNELLINALARHPNLKEMFKGKVVAGSSAGANALASFYYSNDDGKIEKGLGLLPFRVVCHFESEKYKNAHKEGKTILAHMDEYPNDLDLITLKDYEWKEFVV